MRLRSTVNWLLLGLNALLFSVLVVVLLRATVPGEDTDFSRGPFRFSSWKDSSGDTCFTLLWVDGPLDVSLLRAYSIGELAGEARESEKRVVVGLGEQFSAWIGYLGSPTNDLEMREITVRREHGGSYELWTDYGADGSYDTKATGDLKRHVARGYILLEGEWKEVVDTFGDFDKQISGGRRVRFNRLSGLWEVVEQ